MTFLFSGILLHIESDNPNLWGRGDRKTPTGHAWLRIEGCNEPGKDNKDLCDLVKQHTYSPDENAKYEVTIGVYPEGVFWNRELGYETDHHMPTQLNYEEQKTLFEYIETHSNWDYGLIKIITKNSIENPVFGEGVCTDFAVGGWVATGQPDYSGDSIAPWNILRQFAVAGGGGGSWGSIPNSAPIEESPKAGASAQLR